MAAERMGVNFLEGSCDIGESPPFGEWSGSFYIKKWFNEEDKKTRGGETQGVRPPLFLSPRNQK